MTVTPTFQLEAAPVLGELDLVPFSVGDDPTAQGRLAVPLSADTGSRTSLVYLEVDPGHRIAPHTHTADEVFVVLQGTGIVTAGDRQWTASAGSFAVAPAFATHSWENTGSETLRLAAFIDANVFGTSSDEPVAPFGVQSFVVPVQA
jgi:quercetin dioxygenase-like cupin family protein